MKALALKKDKEEALRDNIQMRFKGMGWVEAQTYWSANGRKKSLPELQTRLIEIIKATKKLPVPDQPPANIPQRKEIATLGTLTNKVKEIDAKRAADTDDFVVRAREE